MKRKYFLTQKTGNTFEISPTYYTITARNFAAQSYVGQKNEWVLLEIEHDTLQTQIDLTNLPNYVLVFLEESNSDWKVTGATYCINEHEGAFGIITPIKKILCIPYEAKIDINSLASVTFKQI